MTTLEHTIERAAGDTLLLLSANESLEGMLQKGLLGMNCRLVLLPDPQAALAYAQKSKPALVLVDRHIRSWHSARNHPALSRVPFISIESPETMVQEDDCIAELDQGLDGCLCNQSVRQIVARIRSILRRRPSARAGSAPLHCGPVQMDIARHEVRIGDKPVELTLREFQILRQFLESPEIVLTRQELLNRVWGEDFALEEHALDVHIHALRQKIEEDSSKPRLIVTIRGVGYKLRTPA
ncbi:MAG: response regulator transcription factor [Nitrospiraceae bacterium]|nr:response regulator transcription factor [Nitrospiraceae bacterium]